MKFAALVVAVALIVAACGDSGDSSADDNPAPPSGEFAAGEALYAQNCAQCHGSDLRGTDQGPSHLSIFYVPGHHPDDAFRSAIAFGAPQHHWNFGDMPPVEGLSSDEVEEVIAYVRMVQEREGFEQ
jgi:mono/diheme cytochrome c family protein